MTPLLPGLFSDERAIAPSRVLMSPVVRAARKSGLRVARAKAPTQMLEYRDCLKQNGPATDHEMARDLGWPIATVNARRADLNNHQPGCVEALGRVIVTHPDGKRSSRTLWRWAGPR